MTTFEKQKIKLHIHGITGDGQGVGRLDNGMALFVPGALPGEEVTAVLHQQKKRYAKGELLSIDVASKDRISPACPYDENCGGCVFQHATYAAELDWKRDMVAQTLLRIGGQEVNVEAIDPPASPLHYRNRVVWHVSPEGKLGLFSEKSHRLIDADCLLLEDPLTKATALLREALHQTTFAQAGLKHIALRCNEQGDVLLTFITEKPLSVLEKFSEEIANRFSAPLVVWENWGKPIYSVYGAKWQKIRGGIFTDQLAGQILEIAPAAFLQVNRQETERLYHYVAEFAALRPQDILWDLYAGGGSIGLALGERARKIIAIESYPPAVEAGKRNAQRNHKNNITFSCGKTEDILPELVKKGERAQVAVLDPPRAGCEKAALEALLLAEPNRIVYVSCNPATLARDIKILTQEKYQIHRVKPVDLFPRTGHVETVCLLVRRNSLHIDIDVDVEEMLQEKRGQATYPQIKEYVLEHSGLKVSNLYIAQVKQKCGIIERENYNKPKSEDTKQPQCPPDKEEAIRAALKHFGMI